MFDIPLFISKSLIKTDALLLYTMENIYINIFYTHFLFQIIDYLCFHNFTPESCPWFGCKVLYEY